jgi:two-component system CheB/CheR fusion protein
VEKMAGELIRYVSHPYIEGPRKPVTPRQQYLDALSKIFLLIRSSTGHDFSGYKQTTIRRRIERRMAVHQLENIKEYLRYLQEDDTEVQTLDRDLLIGVTSFFRDKDAFAALTRKAVTAMLEGKKPEAVIRIWVPGCASGEEAYSIAMIILETMEKLGKSNPVQVFATDIDSAAVEYARAAEYPDSIAAGVSQERLKRFFVKGKNTYRIKKHVRDMIVFAVQNLIKDPPFSRVDLVSCRNVLIYMDQVLQKKILPMFHYTLNEGGLLFLGTSESIGQGHGHPGRGLPGHALSYQH